jgi:Vibrio phage DNA polymerase
MAKKKAQPFWTVDCETDPFKAGRVPFPFLWGAFEGESQTYEEFETPAAVADFFSRMSCVVYAHNGGKFDYHYLRDFVNSDDPVMLINGRLARFKIGRAEFRDSLNIFPNTRLKDFDDSTGAKIEIDYSLMEADRRGDPKIREEISRYLRVDCERLWGVVARYRSEYGRSITQASASMKYWENKYYQQPAPRQTKFQYDRYKPYYFGGRVQCFEEGVRSTSFKVADINSAYPFAMLHEHPISPAAVLEKKLPKDSEIHRCLIKLSCVSRGALPWRDIESGELYFPDDDASARRSRTYTITGWEFLSAIELNALSDITIHEVHTFTQVINFKDYIHHFYSQREECRKRGDVAGRIFGKYFMNSLYGKFGANCENYNEYVIATEDSYEEWYDRGYREYKPWGERFLMCRKPDEDQLNNLEGKKWRYYNVATAASVTGFVRAYLFRSLQQCSGAIYCDTDSVAARDTGALSYGTELGKWKDEGKYDRYSIAGKKLYAFHRDGESAQYDPNVKEPSWKIASKGVNFAARPDGPELITRIALGEEIVYEPDVPTYSITRATPIFIGRRIRNTYKNISIAPSL